MSSEDGDFIDQVSGTDAEEDAEGSFVEDAPEQPTDRKTRLKLTLKPRASASNSGAGTPSSSTKGASRGTGRPRGRPRASGGGPTGLTLKVKGKGKAAPAAAEIQEDAPTPMAIDTPIGGEQQNVTSVGGKSYVKIGDQLFQLQYDNLLTREDPVGNTKIDQWGNLLGGREFKAQTFIIPSRHPEIKYMLAIECARSSGYRDSLYYFRRNPLMWKIVLNQGEKEFLIQTGKLHTNLRHRAVTAVTARSAFKQHGAKVIRNGKWVVDDYFEDAAKQEAASIGAKSGDPVITPEADLSHTVQVDREGKQKESRTGIYKAGGPTTFFGSDAVGPFRGEMSSTKKAMLARENLSEENWMHACALSILESNEELRRGRAERVIPNAGLEEVNVGVANTGATVLEYAPGKWDVKALLGTTVGEGGEAVENAEPDTKTIEKAIAESERPAAVYEVHTGILHYPQAFQPTKVRWQSVKKTKHKPVIGGLSSVGSAAWGIGRVEYVMKDEGAYKTELERYEMMHRMIEQAEREGPKEIKMDWDN